MLRLFYCRITMAKCKSQPMTRQLMHCQWSCPVFGVPSEMSANMLPTKFDVMKEYLLRQQRLKNSPTTKEPTFAEIAACVAQHVENLWRKASIPVISPESAGEIETLSRQLSEYYETL